MQNANKIEQIDRPALYHYSKKIVRTVESRNPGIQGCGVYKPDGFWVSVDEPDDEGQPYGWKQWCEAESFALNTLKHRHLVEVDTDRLLWLTSADDLRWFDSTFGIQAYPTIREIDWALVADQFAGVVIAPYQWGCRFDISWYYGWDCASGVIWDSAAIQRVTIC